MNNDRIEFVETLPESIDKIMQEDLVKYESGYGIDVNFKRFSLVLSDEAGNALGVINAFTAFSEVWMICGCIPLIEIKGMVENCFKH